MPPLMPSRGARRSGVEHRSWWATASITTRRRHSRPAGTRSGSTATDTAQRRATSIASARWPSCPSGSRRSRSLEPRPRLSYTAGPMNQFFSGSPPRSFGHRGASGTHPENTLVSFAGAVERGAQAFELDVHRTADGEIVVFHDETLERTTSGRGSIRQRTLAELRALDAGFRFSPDGGRTFPFRGTG